MSDKTRSARDAFAFSLGGLRTAVPFMAVADDGINAAWDERLRNKRESADEPVAGADRILGRFWLSRHQRATQK